MVEVLTIWVAIRLSDGGGVQEPQSVVHFSHMRCFAPLWRRHGVLPVAQPRLLAAWLKPRSNGDRLLPKKKPRTAMSESLRVRLHADERAALGRLATALNERPSRIVRRLIREAITAGPDFFDDGVDELRIAHRELAAVGRNINQLARSANQGERVVPAQLKRNLAAAKLQVERLADFYRAAVARARSRTVQRLG